MYLWRCKAVSEIMKEKSESKTVDCYCIIVFLLVFCLNEVINVFKGPQGVLVLCRSLRAVFDMDAFILCHQVSVFSTTPCEREYHQTLTANEHFFFLHCTNDTSLLIVYKGVLCMCNRF